MKRIWTIVGVKDVATSVAWYQSLFGQPKTPPSHAHFSQILDSDGTVLLCLHQWGEHEHPSLMSPDTATPGNGLLLFFRVDDFDAIAGTGTRSSTSGSKKEPHVNPNTQTQEFSLRDPDGYYVTISAHLRSAPAVRRTARLHSASDCCSRCRHSSSAASSASLGTYSGSAIAIATVVNGFGICVRSQLFIVQLDAASE